MNKENLKMVNTTTDQFIEFHVCSEQAGMRIRTLSAGTVSVANGGKQ